MKNTCAWITWNQRYMKTFFIHETFGFGPKDVCAPEIFTKFYTQSLGKFVKLLASVWANREKFISLAVPVRYSLRRLSTDILGNFSYKFFMKKIWKNKYFSSEPISLTARKPITGHIDQHKEIWTNTEVLTIMMIVDNL